MSTAPTVDSSQIIWLRYKYNNGNNMNHDIYNRHLPSDTIDTHVSVLITHAYIHIIVLLCLYYTPE